MRLCRCIIEYLFKVIKIIFSYPNFKTLSTMDCVYFLNKFKNENRKEISNQHNNIERTNFSLLPQELLGSMKTVMAATNGNDFVLQCTCCIV